MLGIAAEDRGWGAGSGLGHQLCGDIKAGLGFIAHQNNKSGPLVAFAGRGDLHPERDAGIGGDHHISRNDRAWQGADIFQMDRHRRTIGKDQADQRHIRG